MARETFYIKRLPRKLNYEIINNSHILQYVPCPQKTAFRIWREIRVPYFPIIRELAADHMHSEWKTSNCPSDRIGTFGNNSFNDEKYLIIGLEISDSTSHST